MKTRALAVLALLMLPVFNVSAQERCVENPTPRYTPAERARIAELRGYGFLSPDETAELQSLEAKPRWSAIVGAGNGWFDDGPDSCVLYISASGEPVLGTRIYNPRLTADRAETPTGSARQATVVDGPARIRSGPGLEHSGLAWCATGAALTVFPPAVDDWLPASCYGANGWIHQSLVRYDDELAQPETVGDADLPIGGEQALVINGPARIRSGPGLEHSGLAWCANGAALTVFPPAEDDWLPASCYGANGWIYAPLVQVDAPTRRASAPVPAGDAALPASGERAIVISGPAHIRSGPGAGHPHLRWCGIGWTLTVWPPAVDNWLPASCYGANGWIYAPLVQFDDAPSQPGPAPVAVRDETAPASGQPATVIDGPAHIRSGPGQEHPHLRWCGIGWTLTVWPPAQNGWLPASCYGANGWIHESLVRVGAAN